MESSQMFNVVFIGAGNVMFGSDEGPWDHSLRLEQKLGQRFRLVAVIDPNVERAKAALRRKRSSNPTVAASYHSTRVHATFQEFIAESLPNISIHAFVIGCPPMYRGTTKLGKDIEIQILKSLPGVPMFIEKPVATGPESDIQDAFKVAKSITDSKVICSVGYMLRYLRAVQEMKHILQVNHLTVMATIARYACAYQSIAKPDWWDKSKSAGPIVEQATHFCDLSRYFGGEVDIPTVNAHALGWDENPGQLSKVPIDEGKITPTNRIPRVTAATWKYKSGAVGTLTHLVTLQGTDYSCEFEVHADGYLLKLVNPYVHPLLYIRRPGNDHEELIDLSGDDPFFTEISAFVDSLTESADNTQILSTYEDACRSYELSWAITKASERSR